MENVDPSCDSCIHGIRIFQCRAHSSGSIRNTSSDIYSSCSDSPLVSGMSHPLASQQAASQAINEHLSAGGMSPMVLLWMTLLVCRSFAGNSKDCCLCFLAPVALLECSGIQCNSSPHSISAKWCQISKQTPRVHICLPQQRSIRNTSLSSETSCMSMASAPGVLHPL